MFFYPEQPWSTNGLLEMAIFQDSRETERCGWEMEVFRHNWQSLNFTLHVCLVQWFWNKLIIWRKIVKIQQNPTQSNTKERLKLAKIAIRAFEKGKWKKRN